MYVYCTRVIWEKILVAPQERAKDYAMFLSAESYYRETVNLVKSCETVCQGGAHRAAQPLSLFNAHFIIPASTP
jgi:hypothetical protein